MRRAAPRHRRADRGRPAVLAPSSASWCACWRCRSSCRSSASSRHGASAGRSGSTLPLLTYFVFIPVILLIMQLPVTVNGLGTTQVAFCGCSAAGRAGAAAFALSILFLRSASSATPWRPPLRVRRHRAGDAGRRRDSSPADALAARSSCCRGCSAADLRACVSRRLSARAGAWAAARVRAVRAKSRRRLDLRRAASATAHRARDLGADRRSDAASPIAFVVGLARSWRSRGWRSARRHRGAARRAAAVDAARHARAASSCSLTLGRRGAAVRARRRAPTPPATATTAPTSPPISSGTRALTSELGKFSLPPRNPIPRAPADALLLDLLPAARRRSPARRPGAAARRADLSQDERRRRRRCCSSRRCSCCAWTAVAARMAGCRGRRAGDRRVERRRPVRAVAILAARRAARRGAQHEHRRAHQLVVAAACASTACSAASGRCRSTRWPTRSAWSRSRSSTPPAARAPLAAIALAGLALGGADDDQSVRRRASSRSSGASPSSIDALAARDGCRAASCAMRSPPCRWSLALAWCVRQPDGRRGRRRRFSSVARRRAQPAGRSRCCSRSVRLLIPALAGLLAASIIERSRLAQSGNARWPGDLAPASCYFVRLNSTRPGSASAPGRSFSSPCRCSSRPVSRASRPCGASRLAAVARARRRRSNDGDRRLERAGHQQLSPESPIGPWTVSVTPRPAAGPRLDPRDDAGDGDRADGTDRARPQHWSLIPCFAERRMAAGLPISLLGGTPTAGIRRALRPGEDDVRDARRRRGLDDIARALRIDYL